VHGGCSAAVMPWKPGNENPSHNAMKYTVHSGESEFEVDINRDGVIRLNGLVLDADLQHTADPTLYSLILAHRSYELRVEPGDGKYSVQLHGITCDVVVEDERARLLAGLKSAPDSGPGEVAIKSPMPGIVIDIPVSEGDVVEAGQTLVVVESMKMHNEFHAPRAGTIKAVRVARGAKVLQNTILITLA
jgi:biotin carboxyl carrier protein